MTDIHRIEEQLEVTPQITGGNVMVTGLAWYGKSGVMPWLEPQAILDFDIELHNQNTQPLELVSSQVIVHDVWGRTATGGVYRHGPGTPNRRVLLYPGDIRSISAAGILLPMPLTWSRAELRVTLKPADPATLRASVRWHDFTIQSEQRNPDGSYHLIGTTQHAEQRVGDSDARPAAVVSFYNAQGEFVRGGTWPLAGGNILDVDFKPGAVPRGPVTQARVFFIEAYGPPIQFP